MSKILSVLVSINVQAKSDINQGGQGMVFNKSRGGYPTVFSASKTYAIFVKQANRLCL